MTAKEFFEKNENNAELKAQAVKAAEGGADSFEAFLKEQGVEIDYNELLGLSIDVPDGAKLDDDALDDVAGGANLTDQISGFINRRIQNWGVGANIIGAWIGKTGQDIGAFFANLGKSFGTGINNIGSAVNNTVNQIFGKH